MTLIALFIGVCLGDERLEFFLLSHPRRCVK